MLFPSNSWFLCDPIHDNAGGCVKEHDREPHGSGFHWIPGGQMRLMLSIKRAFTLSNLGTFLVDRFDAILPPGQGAIMSVGELQHYCCG
ncbi:hypothetical protein J5N97_007009 [Dioscorea zingiberensis]|uniref:2-oxoacid dehydrogenase acyltransferase catalytic domain-containing protein n=1 Tax=Dioscorea zingiberensis TaxID=325984 RepID=A0A9D5HU28_9LILI|nr:hypothetical protein J5N97_007009 [Dioscorea zingiberensis]